MSRKSATRAAIHLQLPFAGVFAISIPCRRRRGESLIKERARESKVNSGNKSVSPPAPHPIPRQHKNFLFRQKFPFCHPRRFFPRAPSVVCKYSFSAIHPSSASRPYHQPLEHIHNFLLEEDDRSRNAARRRTRTDTKVFRKLENMAALVFFRHTTNHPPQHLAHSWHLGGGCCRAQQGDFFAIIKMS